MACTSIPASMWVSLTRGQVALQSLGNGWHTFLYISLTIIILSLKFYSMKHRSSISVEKITVGNLRLKKKKKGESNVFDTNLLLKSACWQKPPNYNKGKNLSFLFIFICKGQ